MILKYMSHDVMKSSEFHAEMCIATEPADHLKLSLRISSREYLNFHVRVCVWKMFNFLFLAATIDRYAVG